MQWSLVYLLVLKQALISKHKAFLFLFCSFSIPFPFLFLFLFLFLSLLLLLSLFPRLYALKRRSILNSAM